MTRSFRQSEKHVFAMTKTVLESLVADRLAAIRSEIVDLAASDEGTSAERRINALALFDKWDALFSEWDIAQRALSSSEEPQAEYSEYKRATDAILDYLEKVGKPITRKELALALIERGFQRGKKTEWVIGQAINSFLY